jgi:hypothetical protein
MTPEFIATYAALCLLAVGLVLLVHWLDRRAQREPTPKQRRCMQRRRADLRRVLGRNRTWRAS